MNQSFNLNRIGWLSKKEFYLNFLPHFKIMSIVLSALFLLRCIISYFDNTGVIRMQGYEGMFIVFGFIYTISTFKELKYLPTRADFLAFPASVSEKVFTKWLFANVFYWIAVILLFTTFYFLQKFVIGFCMGKSMESFDLLSRMNLSGLHYLIIVFSVYFFGAAAFNTGGWYKIITWAIVLSLVYMFLIFIFAYALFPELRAIMHDHSSHSLNINGNVPMDVMMEDFWVFKVSKSFLLYLAAPFFWFMTYLKIKEKEV